MAGFKKPLPRPAKAPPAFAELTSEDRSRLAASAEYVGSPHHTDIPKYGMRSNPRSGAAPIEVADEEGLKNPACTICPRKWARHQENARNLLRAAIQAGNFVVPLAGCMPSRVWARDPDKPDLVYEAKLAYPPHGYKAYPLTRYQSEYNIPFRLP